MPHRTLRRPGNRGVQRMPDAVTAGDEPAVTAVTARSCSQHEHNLRHGLCKPRRATEIRPSPDPQTSGSNENRRELPRCGPSALGLFSHWITSPTRPQVKDHPDLRGYQPDPSPPERDHRPQERDGEYRVHHDPGAAVVETVVRTLWTAVGQAERGGTPMDDRSWLGGTPRSPMRGVERVPFTS